MRSLRMLSFGVLAGLVTFATLPASAQQGGREGAAIVAGPAGRDAVTDPAGSRFWDILGDPVLDRLMSEALRGNLEVRAADARVDGAGAVRLQAALELVPSVSASAGFTRRRISSAAFPGPGSGTLPAQNLWDSGLNASWEIDYSGRLRDGLRARNALQDAAAVDVRDVQVSVAAEVARTYFDLRGAQHQLAVARRNADNQRRTLDLTRTRIEAGRGTEFDSERARAQLESTRAVIPALDANVAALQYRMSVLLGRAPHDLDAELAGVSDFPVLPDSVPAMSPAEVIRVRPGVLSAADRVEASRALVRSARADYLPRLSLVAGAGYMASAFDAFGSSGTLNYTFGPVISWPAFDMGRVKARVDQMQALELEARARYQQVLLQAQERLETSQVHYRTARARVAHLRAAAEASERAAALAMLRYEGGVADFLQVLDAERTMLSAQDQFARGQTEAAAAYVALFEARGGSWTSNLNRDH